VLDEPDPVSGRIANRRERAARAAFERRIQDLASLGRGALERNKSIFTDPSLRRSSLR
jgi:hypothetical protein